jgi:hypothetical protein
LEDAYELWGEFGPGIMDFHIVGGAPDAETIEVR